MKRLLLSAWLFAAALALKGDDAPTLDVFAGWAWSPFYYDRYPYGYGPCWRDYPTVGVGAPLTSWDGYPYGYYGYPPFWGYEYGMRIHLKEKRYAPVLSENLLPPYPGTAPTDLRDLPREKQWDHDINSLLGSSPSESKSTAPTNNAPTKLLIPNS